MKTDDLISALATNEAALAPEAQPRLLWALVAGVISSLVVCALFWGFLSQLLTVMQTPAFVAKIGLGIATAALALMAWPAMLRPGQLKSRALLVALVPAVLVWLWALLGTATPLVSQAFGGMWTTCTISIAALALPVWLWLVWHAKHFAPTALRQAGAISGAIAGGVGAAVYSLYCPVFDAGYIAVWYVLGIGVCIALGALAGPRALRW